MRHGACPKCSSSSIYAARGGVQSGAPAALAAHIEPGFRGIRATRQADGLWQFVCADCGYLEAYVLDDESRAFVRQHWLPV